MEVLPQGDHVLLWHRWTGRHALVPRRLRPGHEALLKRLHMHAAAPIGQLVPVRSRWSLLLPERPALWHALPLERGPGGFPFTATPLLPWELELLRGCNGARRLEELVDPARARPLLERLCARGVQALQLRDGPLHALDPGPWTLHAPERPGEARQAHHLGPEGQTSLGRYHEEIDPEGHFDRRETTLAHAFARPHAALSGRRYGEALRSALAPSAGTVVEVGAGTGELARDFLRAGPLDYTRVDRSPGLLALQDRTSPATRGVLGDAGALPLRDESVDLLLSNEVLADLEASPDPGSWPVRPELGQRLFNTGAFRLVAEAWRVLRPGGRLWLSEFGALDEHPVETRQLDHPEVSVHFGQVLQVARALGLSARVRPLSEAMGFDLSARWLSRPSWEAMRCLDPDLPARAWTAETVPRPEAVEGLADRAITQDGPGPVVTRFQVLEATKPAG